MLPNQVNADKAQKAVLTLASDKSVDRETRLSQLRQVQQTCQECIVAVGKESNDQEAGDVEEGQDAKPQASEAAKVPAAQKLSVDEIRQKLDRRGLLVKFKP